MIDDMCLDSEEHMDLLAQSFRGAHGDSVCSCHEKGMTGREEEQDRQNGRQKQHFYTPFLY